MKLTPKKNTVPHPNTPTLRRMAMLAVALSLALVPGRALAGRPLGVDVYDGTGSVNWTSVHNSGVSFAWAKATEGNYYQDANYAANISNGKAADIYMGAYHYARPDLNTASTEAAYFWSYAKGHIAADGSTLMPMLDFEVFNGSKGAADYADWANQWCAAVTSDAGDAQVVIQPALYTSSCYACDFNSSVSQLLADVANYNGESAQSGNPWNVCTSCEVWGAGVWNVWQYSSSGSVPGISGNADEDVFNGNLAQLVSTMVATSGATKVKNPPNPSANNDTDGRIELFAVDGDGSLGHDWQTADNGGWAGTWPSMGGSGIKKTVTGANANGNLQTFVIEGDSHVYQTYWTGSGWTALSQLGVDSFKDICVASNPNGTLELFGISTSGVLYHNYQTSVNGYNSWSTWISIGGSGGTRVEAANNQNGNIGVFFLGTGGVLYQSFSGGTENYVTPSSLGGVSSDLTVVGWAADGHLEVFAVGGGGSLYHIWQIGANGSGGWSGWAELGGVNYTRVKGAINSANNPEIFTITQSGAMVHFYWNSTDGWDGPFSLGGINESFTVKANGNGDLNILAVGTTGQMYIKTYLAGETGWTGWSSLGGSLEY